MVGAGQLIQLLFGLPYLWAVIIVGWISIAVIEWRVRRESASLPTEPAGVTGSEI